MSSEPAPPPSATPATKVPVSAVKGPVKYGGSFFRLSHERRPGEIKVFQHSMIFYYWPVWLVGFIFAGISYFSGYLVAIVPERTIPAEVVHNGQTREAMVLDANQKLVTRTDPDTKQQVWQEPIAHVAPFRGLGTLFCILLLVVIIFTTMAFRGLLSVFLVISIGFLILIFFLMGWWDIIFSRLGQLAIYISAGGYFSIALVLFILWTVNVFILDRQTYMIVNPSQIRVKLEFGGGEIGYSSKGFSIHKMRGDFVRHWLLGLGSGDVEVHLEGTRPLLLHNVIHADKVIKEMESVVQEQAVIREPTPAADIQKRP